MATNPTGRVIVSHAWGTLVGMVCVLAIWTFLVVVLAASAVTWGPKITATLLAVALLGVIGLANIKSVGVPAAERHACAEEEPGG